MDWLKVDGRFLVDTHGRHVRLRGIGLGGWMNMENFITGYAGDETTFRSLLRDRMGDEAYQAYAERFLTSFFTGADAEYIASLGMNLVRLPVNYRHFEDDDRPFVLKEEGFAQLDRVVRLLIDHGLYVIIDLHALPGRQNQHWHSDNPTHLAEFWRHPHFQDRVVNLWEALADRYKDEPGIAGYNPINEPSDPSGTALMRFYDRLSLAIRAIDKRHILFLEGNRFSTEFDGFDNRPEPIENAVYTAHDYALPGITYTATYPGTVGERHYDQGVLEEVFLRRTEYMRRTGTPIWIGEFGPLYPTDRPVEQWRYQVLRDQLEIYDRHHASWALWTYKDIGLQGIVHLPPGSGYLRRIQTELELKARLGVDAWGSSDDGLRAVLDPLRELFAAEFPRYDPWPWGNANRLALLVRHILLAEPVAERIADRYAGLSPAEAKTLADEFEFSRCRVRSGLADLLRENLR